MSSNRRIPWYGRFAVALVGVGFLATSLGHLLRGHLFYQNYWGGAAFVPIGLIVGSAAIYLAIFGKGGNNSQIRDKKKRRH